MCDGDYDALSDPCLCEEGVEPCATCGGRGARLRKADHIAIAQRTSVVTYVHHGLYDGKGGVYHYARPGILHEICHTPLEDFLMNRIKGNVLVVFEYKKCATAETAIRRAAKRVGETEYSLGKNNCEHFVTQCKTGFPQSEQIEGTKNLAIGVGTVIVSAVSVISALILWRRRS